MSIPKNIFRYTYEYWIPAMLMLGILWLTFGYLTFILTLIPMIVFFYYRLLQVETLTVNVKHELPVITKDIVILPNRPNPIKIFKRSKLLDVFNEETFQDFILNSINRDFLTSLPIVYGWDSDNELVIGDLCQAPSLLIGGISGSGKSTLLHSILAVLLTYHTPKNLELHLCDTKRVELARYAKFPHTKQIIYNHEDINNFLSNLLVEINQRYLELQELDITSIAEYNKLNLGINMKMPYMVVVIEELGDLMLDADKTVQNNLIKILQKGRAAGVHVIALTQRPSASIINSSIKANIPNRVALRVASSVDSKIILDRTGAENLTNHKGEMLIIDGGQVYQATSNLVTNEEIIKLRDEWLN